MRPTTMSLITKYDSYRICSILGTISNGEKSSRNGTDVPTASSAAANRKFGTTGSVNKAGTAAVARPWPPPT